MSQQPPYTVARYFAGLTETTFQAELGVVDPPLVDYVADLLVRSIRNEALNGIRDTSGRPISSVAAMAAEAAQRFGSARRDTYRYIGDFTLFWAGVYPEALRQGSSTLSDQWQEYRFQGRLAYRLASEMEPELDNKPDSEILHRLSEQFDLCCYGLREIRRHWEEGDLPPDQPLVIP